MPRELKFPRQRTVRLSPQGEELLITIAAGNGITANEQARIFVEEGLRKHYKKLGAGGKKTI